MTSPVMNLRPKHWNPPSPGGSIGSSGGVDVTAAAPSHGGGRDFNDDNGGAAAQEGCCLTAPRTRVCGGSHRTTARSR
ncbi:unnamed protein product [Ectocarpus sp. 8 AP-2014]